MPKKYRIQLSCEERLELQTIVRNGKAAASMGLRAQMLLATGDRLPNEVLVDTDAPPGTGRRRSNGFATE